jgi:hypothetical protein
MFYKNDINLKFNDIFEPRTNILATKQKSITSRISLRMTFLYLNLEFSILAVELRRDKTNNPCHGENETTCIT